MRLLAALLLAIAGAAAAGDAVPAAPSALETLFAGAPAFSGTLGELKIQARLRQKEDMREGVEGEYFVFGRSQKILLAGEFEPDGSVFLEESEDGRSVSGQWDGKLVGDLFSGTWSSFDGSVSKPFALKLIAARVQSPAPALRSAAAGGAGK